MRRVYIHVGLPKTGTTYLQKTLWASRDRLSKSGVLVPGDREQFQRHAVWDLLGRRIQGADQMEVAGSWQALVDTVRAGDAQHVVVSEEFLVHAGPRVARRIVDDLEAAEVHVVVTVRDLGRAIVSMWQQNMAKGRTWTLPEFVAAVRDPDHGPATAGVAFWMRYDLRRVLGMWTRVVPDHRIHVVVVPGAGSAPTALLERFAVACDLDVSDLTPPAREANRAVSMVGAELLRRLNLRLGKRLNESQYRHIIGLLSPALHGEASNGPIPLPAQERAWVGEKSTELVQFLNSSPYDLIGDVDDLLLVPAPDVGGDLAEVTETELAAVAIEALAVTAERHAKYWSRARHPERSGNAPATNRLASAGRALIFSAKVRALDAADRNRLLGKAAALHLRGTSRSTPRQ